MQSIGPSGAFFFEGGDLSGTLFGLGLSQQMDLNGQPMVGALLYIYAANSSTPVTSYKDSGLTAGQEHPWPIETDSNGRIPAFWLADGSYRARFTDSLGIVQFDVASMLALGASSGEAGADTTDPNSVFSTGMPIWMPITGTKSGWVRMNGRTIGSATSGAAERANADCEALFLFIWANYANAICAVTGGRGVSAAADWSANKRIATLDMRGKGPFGLDDMGNSALSAFSGVSFDLGDATTAGAQGGDATKVLVQANLPNVTLATDIASGQGAHTHSVKYNQITEVGAGAGAVAKVSAIASAGTQTGSAAATSSTLPGMTGTTPTGGSDTAVQTISPFALGSWYWRL